jgi:DNA excision repair protein ERCC-1
MDDEFGDVPDFGALIEEGPTVPNIVTQPLPSHGKQPERPPPKVQQPKPQALPARAGPSAILVSPRQKGNPILSLIRMLPWEHADIPADYVLGSTTCALFLSLKYHRLHPEYIYSRLRLLAGKYNLRILLVMVDIPNHEDSLKELSKTSLVNKLTLILCWSAAEAAHYLELFKASENAQPTAIRTRQAQSYSDSLVEFVTTPRSINKSDAASLISTFGSLQAAVNARPEQIGQVPGWGEKKMQQWSNAVQEPFRAPIATRKGVGSLSRRGAPSREAVAGPVADDPDDDEGISVLLEESTRMRENLQPQTTRQDEVSEGVLAALSRLREQAG